MLWVPVKARCTQESCQLFALKTSKSLKENFVRLVQWCNNHSKFEHNQIKTNEKIKLPL